jgi:hypothetical protein
LARVLGERQWEEVSVVYRRQGHQLPDDSLSLDIAAARSALRELVAGKRYVVPQRWRNMRRRRASGGSTSPAKPT